MIYTVVTLSQCVMSDIVYVNGNERDAYQCTGIFGDDIRVTNLRSGKSIKLPGGALVERPYLEGIKSHRVRSISSRLFGAIRGHKRTCEEHGVECPTGLFEILRRHGFDPDAPCTGVVSLGPPRQKGLKKLG